MDIYSPITADGICKCCKRNIEGGNDKRLLCDNCEPYIKRLVDKYNHRIHRHRKLLRDYKSIGDLGRIQQKIQLYNDSKRIIKNLKNRVRYYENKSITKKGN